ncbi:MAG: YjgN family protein [Deltaproteobacteria bacterium]|nr:YjgN family protein [Deltaproteobacteria bacterium]
METISPTSPLSSPPTPAASPWVQPAEAPAGPWVRGYFTGSGKTLFGLFLANALLTLLTLGLYSPWAKVRWYKMLAHNSRVLDTPFDFHGRGIELLKGRLLITVLAIGLMAMGQTSHLWEIQIQLIYQFSVMAAFFLVLPWVILAAYRFRLSRLSWRQIHFACEGEFSAFVRRMYLDMLLVILSLGLYFPMVSIRMHQYLWSRIRLGNLRFTTDAGGMDYYRLYTWNALLTLLTLGVFRPWMVMNLTRYRFSRLRLEGAPFQFTGKGGAYLWLVLGNFAIVILTLQLGRPWAMARTYRFYADHLMVHASVPLDKLQQHSVTLKRGVAEELADFLDIGM